MNDLTVAVRQLTNRPGLSALMIATLAIGIGANTAIYSVLDAVLLRPAPFAAVERLVMLWETDRATGTRREPASVPDFLDYRAAARTVQVSAMAGGEANFVPAEGDPERLVTLQVSHDLLPMLGVVPLAGRSFTEVDDRAGALPVVIVSRSLARRLFNEPTRAIGHTINLDDRLHTIVGVVAESTDFGVLQVLSAAAYARSFADRGQAARIDVWAPMVPDPVRLPRETHPIFMLGRLAQGATPDAVQAELTAMATQLEATYPVNRARGVYVEPLTDVIFAPVRPVLYLLLGAVAMVLLIACVNVANLMLARGAARRQEIAVRRAVGADAWRLLRQFLLESTVFSALAALAGLALAFLSLQALLSRAPGDIPRLSLVTLDGGVLGAALVVASAVAITFGIVPTLQARRVDLAAALRDDGGGRGSVGRTGTRLRRALVVIELAAAVMLLTGSGLLIRSVWKLQHVETGFRAAGVLKAEYQLPPSRYPITMQTFPNFPEQFAFAHALLEQAAALPGVTSVALAGNHPLDPGFTNSFRIVGRENEATSWPEISTRRVSPGYLSTVGLPLIRGRWLSEQDLTSGPPVAVINEATARRFFDGRDPIGAQIRFWGAARTIVGVVGNETFQGLGGAPPIAVYVSTEQIPAVNGAGVLLVKTAAAPLTLAGPVRQLFRQRDPLLAIFGLEPLEAALSRSVSQQRFAMLLVTTFAAIALLLAASGVYGVLSYDVTLRTREIGIRLALGAQRLGIVRMVVSQALVLVAIALAIGLSGALGLSRVLTSLLFAVEARDPLTLIGVATTLGLVGLVAAAVPAWRASRTAPSLALRT